MFAIFVILFTLVAALVVFSPTLLYLAIFPRVLRFAVNRSRVRLVLSIYAFAPLVFWAISLGVYFYQNRALEQRVRAAPTFSMPKNLPDTLVIETNQGSVNPHLNCFANVMTPGTSTETDPPLPERYIALRLGRMSSYALPGIDSEDRTPYELLLVENGKRQLLALNYPSPLQAPLPIFSLRGWFTLPVSPKSDVIDAHIAQFMRSRIKGC